MPRYMIWGTTLLCGLGALLSLHSQPVMAQTALDLEPSSPQKPLDIFRQEESDSASDLFSDRSGNNSLLNLLNRLQLINSRSPGEYAEDLDKNVNDAAAAFREKQNQKLGIEPAATPAVPNPE